MIFITEREWQARRRKVRVLQYVACMLFALIAIVPATAAIYLAFFRDR